MKMKIRMLVPVLSILLLVSCATPGAAQTTKPTEKTPVATQKVTTPTNANGYSRYTELPGCDPKLVSIHLLDAKISGTTATFTFEFKNNSSNSINISSERFFINDYEVKTYMTTNVSPGMKTIDTVNVYDITASDIKKWGGHFEIKSSSNYRYLDSVGFVVTIH